MKSTLKVTAEMFPYSVAEVAAAVETAENNGDMTIARMLRGFLQATKEVQGEDEKRVKAYWGTDLSLHDFFTGYKIGENLRFKKSRFSDEQWDYMAQKAATYVNFISRNAAALKAGKQPPFSRSHIKNQVFKKVFAMLDAETGLDVANKLTNRIVYLADTVSHKLKNGAFESQSERHFINVFVQIYADYARGFETEQFAHSTIAKRNAIMNGDKADADATTISPEPTPDDEPEKE